MSQRSEDNPAGVEGRKPEITRSKGSEDYYVNQVAQNLN